MCRYRIFAFFTAIYPKITLKSVKGVWHCHAFILRCSDKNKQPTRVNRGRRRRGKREKKKKERKKKRASFSSKGSSSLAWEYNRLSSLIAAWDVDASPAKRPWRRGARSDCCIRRLVAPDKNCVRKRKRAFFPFSVPSRKLTACYILSLPGSGKCSRCY